MKKMQLNFRRLGIFLLLWSVALFVSAQQKEITGKIVEASNGASIPGATVIVEGTQRGVITDTDGNFVLTVSESESLIVSYLGYKLVKIPVAGKNTFLIPMEPEFISFDEVVVIGYGMQRKGDLTGAISNIQSKDFNKGVVSSPEQLINGKVSGVQIMSSSGSPHRGVLYAFEEVLHSMPVMIL